jgi:hypothetical protein
MVDVQAEDMTVHFQWHTRNDAGKAGDLEVDSIIFPEEAAFRKVM